MATDFSSSIRMLGVLCVVTMFTPAFATEDILAIPGLIDIATDEDEGFESPIEGLLQNRSLSNPQRVMGGLIEEVCPGGLSRGVIGSSAAGRDLADRCTDVVVQALEGGSVSAVLQNMAAEEVNVVGSSEVDASAGQMDAISQRLGTLRAGGSRVALAAPGFDSRSLAAGDGDRWLNGGGAGDGAGASRGFFISGNYAANDRDGTVNESGFESDTYGVTSGVDFQVTPRLLLGAAFTYSTIDADISGNAGTMETDSYGGFGYGTLTLGTSGYLDAMIGYTRNEHEQSRNLAYTAAGVRVDQSALSELDSREIAGSLKLGYDHAAGNWVLGPYARLDIADVEIDGYSEQMSNPNGIGSGLALQIDEQSFTSITSAFGLTAGYLSAQSWGTWYPQIIAEYVHEFDNDAENVTGRFVNAPTVSFAMPMDDPDRDFAHVGVSSTFALNSGVSMFASYQALVGYENLDTHVVEFGVRVPF